MPVAHRRSVTRWLAGALSAAVAVTGMVGLAPADAAVAAAAPAFDCTEPRFFAQAEQPVGTAQLFQGRYTAAGDSKWDALGGTVSGASLYNALAFNPKDEYLYGTVYGSTAPGSFVRIDRTGAPTNIGAANPDLGNGYSTLWDAGEFAPDGAYYVASGNSGTRKIFKITGLDKAPGVTPTRTEITLSTPSNITFADLAYKDGYLWAHSYGAGTNAFYRIALDGTVTTIASTVIPALSYGSAFTMTNGNLAFVGTNNQMYQVSVTDPTGAAPTFELISTVAAPTNQRSDATNCSTALPASLSVTKTGPATVIKGEEIVWTVTVTNDGPGISSGFSAIDSLPAGLSGVSATSSESSCSISGRTITCNGGRMAVGDTATITVKATAPTTVGAIVNSVRIVGNEDSTPSSSAPSTEVSLGTAAGGTDTAVLVLGPTEDGAAVTDGSNGTVENDKGTLVYTPKPGFSGVDSFTYTPKAGGPPVTVYVTVVPKAVPDTATTSINTPVSGSVATNDSGLNLLFAKEATPSNGTVVVNSDGSFTYTPNNGYTGSDQFTYTVTGDGGSATAAVAITVLAGPSAVADSVTTPANTAVENIDVLANDVGSVLSAVLLAGATSGTVVDNGDNTFTYTPNAGFSGTDSFTYTLTGTGGTATGTVTVTVKPVATNDSMSTTEASATSLDVRLNDVGVSLTAAVLAGPTHGTATVASGGVITYTPTTGYSGPDSFTYTLTGAGGTATGTVSVLVSPRAPNDAATTVSGQSVSIDVLANDRGTGLTITAVGSATSGTTSIVAGEVVYRANSGFSGVDTFTYTAEDASGTEATATVTVTVTPVAVDDTITTTAGSPITASLVQNDLGTDLTVTLVTAPVNGSVVVNANGSMMYTPRAGFSGYDTFDYIITDTEGNSATATVTISVTPAAAADAQTAAPGSSLRMSLIGNDVGTGLSVTSVTQPANGTVVLNGDNTVTYTPRIGFSGRDSFSYTVTDADGLSATATASIDVQGLGTLPTTGFIGHGVLVAAVLLVLGGAVMLNHRPRRSRHRA